MEKEDEELISIQRYLIIGKLNFTTQQYVIDDLKY